MEVVMGWDAVVRPAFPRTSPWCTPIDSHWGEQSLSMKPPGYHRNLALNKLLRRLWEIAGMPDKSVHKFRHWHAVYGLQHARTIADYMAVSMNLMHENINFTDEVYVLILSNEVQQRIANLDSQSEKVADDQLENLISRFSNAELSKVVMIVARRLAK
jgi:integrase